MSRGDRVASPGNISTSMRSNYGEFGVDEYYRKVGATYRNPHFPGIKACIFQYLNKWFEQEAANLASKDVIIFDLACGSGEVTISVLEWWALGRQAHHDVQGPTGTLSGPARRPCGNRRQSKLPRLGLDAPEPRVIAADPFTSEAYSSRTSMKCAQLSFRDVADGALPDLPIFSASLHQPTETTTDALPLGQNLAAKSAVQADFPAKEPHFDLSGSTTVIEMVFCSFALHLIENSSELFSVLWELSSKCRWLIVLAPHKKPEIKENWGWTQWNMDSWQAMNPQQFPEIVNERVRCRLYRSTNIV